jgi:lysophospholipase L1-like esterase
VAQADKRLTLPPAALDAAVLLAGPLLLLQSWHVRRRTPTLPEPDGPRAGSAGGADAAPPLRLLVAGDSAAAGVGASTQSEALAQPLAERLARRLARGVRWQLIAKTGLTSAGLLLALTEAPVEPADVAAVVVGVNDLTTRVPLDQAIRQRAQIARRLHERAGVWHVSFLAAPDMSVFPTLPQPLSWFAGQLARRNNAVQAAWAQDEPGVSHVPMDIAAPQFATDGFHPGPAAYSVIADGFADHLANRISRRDLA